MPVHTFLAPAVSVQAVRSDDPSDAQYEQYRCPGLFLGGAVDEPPYPAPAALLIADAAHLATNAGRIEVDGSPVRHSGSPDDDGDEESC